MDRRSFLRGLWGAGAAAAGVSLLGPLAGLAGPAEATPLDVLRGMAQPDESTETTYGEAPDGTAVEDVQARRRQVRRSNRRYYRRRRYVRRGRYWNNGRWWGGRRRVCWTSWDRWGRPFRRCGWRYW
ncbi:twin-arginine translocation signal domain-containing protein [Ancylobacter terrae]|uniref:twin-arginine translocation signal domain-containing protein n=1 Tax=Ancylobacter sp. sgz301288 TaxID=3342077 RepID=UPI00385EF0A4